MPARYSWKDGVMSDPDLTNTILVNVQATMAAMKNDMAAMRSDMNTRFDAVDRRFESMEDRLEHLDHHAVVTNSKLDTLTKRVAHVEVVCEEGWAQVATTATYANRFEQRLTSELADLRTRVEKLEDKDRE
jgi:predicted  nucleic acid-binding Zn-ribbon protein